jgi:hypothetical protein
MRPYRIHVIPWLRRPGGRLLLPNWLAITIGSRIFCWRPLDEAELAHEVEHVRQWQRYGLRFIPRYVRASLRAWRGGDHRYYANTFEVAARAVEARVRASVRAAQQERPADREQRAGPQVGDVRDRRVRPFDEVVEAERAVVHECVEQRVDAPAEEPATEERDAARQHPGACPAHQQDEPCDSEAERQELDDAVGTHVELARRLVHGGDACREEVVRLQELQEDDVGEEAAETRAEEDRRHVARPGTRRPS